MKRMDEAVAILTSKDSWFVPYARCLVVLLRKYGLIARLFFTYNRIPSKYRIVFVLSYFRIIPERFLKRHAHNIVVHESALPKGKGWAPLTWQILEGKNKIPVVLFEASGEVDAGGIYIKDTILLKGDELYEEIREKQAQKILQLCQEFIRKKNRIKIKPQKGESSFYPRRTPADSHLSLNKGIKEQFNLLRTVDNEAFPAFFCYKGSKYIIKIYKDKKRVC